MGDKTKYDSIFKKMVKTVFFKLLNSQTNEKIEEYEDITSQPIELPKTLDRKADFVFLVKKEDEKSIFHLEIQTDNDDNMQNRMFTYAALLNESYNTKEKDIVKPFMPIRQAVIYLGHLERDKKLESKMIFELDFGYHIYKYKIINISSIPYDEFLKDKETLVFAILGNFQSLDAVLVVDKIVDAVLKYVDNIIERNELLIDILMLANLRKLTEVVKEKIENNPKIMAHNIDFTQFPLYLEGKLEGKLEEKEEIAEIMLREKMPILQIVKFTGLTFEQVKIIQSKMGM